MTHVRAEGGKAEAAAAALADLPAAPEGMTGWPWDPVPARAGDREGLERAWPRITVVTPSYNQGPFLEEAIRSVLLQGYPDLEYIVIDGGSSDGSKQIIERYAPWLSFWVSEPDRGQSHALNKGFQRCSGEILCWLNSDDLLEPDALLRVARRLAGTRSWLVGACREVDPAGSVVGCYAPEQPGELEAWIARLLTGQTYSLPQPSTFWTRAVWERAGKLDEHLHFSFDHAFFLRALATCGPPALLREPLARFRLHDKSKTSTSRLLFKVEAVRVARAALTLLPVRRRLRPWALSWHRQRLFQLQHAAASQPPGRSRLLAVSRVLIRAPHLLGRAAFWRALRALPVPTDSRRAGA